MRIPAILGLVAACLVYDVTAKSRVVIHREEIISDDVTIQDDVIIEIVESSCSPSPCHNNGTCIKFGDDDFMCTCQHGYYGNVCQNKIPCTGDTCLNGGTCVTLSRRRFSCQCRDGYHGNRCENASPCLSDPCKHGSTCNVVPTSGEPTLDVPVILYIHKVDETSTDRPRLVYDDLTYQCTCHPGYFGRECEKRMPCQSKPCFNGGSCTDLDENNFRCTCPGGKTGFRCESDVTCDSGEEFAKQNNAYMSDAEIRRPLIRGRTKDATCNFGYYSRRWTRQTTIRCEEEGFWTMSFECKPVACRIRDLDRAFVVGDRSGNVTFGETINYKCQDGYQMTGNGSVECTFDRQRYYNNNYRPYYEQSFLSLGVLKPLGEQWPVCLPIEGCSNPPPIEGASLVSVNSTKEYGEAEYTCSPGYSPMGDGKSRCWKIGQERIYDGRNSKTYSSDKFEWIFLPKCERLCEVGLGRAGNRSNIMVKVTKCSTTSFARYPRESCEEPVIHQVKKDDANKHYSSMVFYGEDLCVSFSRLTVKRYEEVNYEQNTSKCFNFCIPHHHGFYRAIVQDNMIYSRGKLSLERIVYKYQTL